MFPRFHDGLRCLFAMAVIMGQAGCFALEPPYLYEMYVVIALLAVLAFWEHRANIKRLIAGTERKTYLSKKVGEIKYGKD